MKLQLCVLGLSALALEVAKPEDVTIYLPAEGPSLRSSTITLKSNEVAVLRYAIVDSPATALTVDNGTNSYWLPVPGGPWPTYGTPTIAGPADIYLLGSGGGTLNSLCSFSITRLADKLPVDSIPSNAIVIPADSSGQVQIILESSADLVTWNAATPGTYGAQTEKRFFRVRAQRVSGP